MCIFKSYARVCLCSFYTDCNPHESKIRHIARIRQYMSTIVFKSVFQFTCVFIYASINTFDFMYLNILWGI